MNITFDPAKVKDILPKSEVSKTVADTLLAINPEDYIQFGIMPSPDKPDPEDRVPHVICAMRLDTKETHSTSLEDLSAGEHKTVKNVQIHLFGYEGELEEDVEKRSIDFAEKEMKHICTVQGQRDKKGNRLLFMAANVQPEHILMTRDGENDVPVESFKSEFSDITQYLRGNWWQGNEETEEFVKLAAQIQKDKFERAQKSNSRRQNPAGASGSGSQAPQTEAEVEKQLVGHFDED